MDFHVQLHGPGDLAARIYRSLLEGILEGRLRAGEQLPPSRQLALGLGVSRNTVATAYGRLTAEGFLVGRVGAGTFVSDAIPATGQPRSRNTGHGALTPRPGWTFNPTPTSSQQKVPRYDFRVGLPDPTLFPFDTWRRLVSSELRLNMNDPGTYAEPSGHLGLRKAIARYVGYSRSIRADADDVLITNGTQQSLDLIARVLITPGDIVAVEEPGYPAARALFASLGARVVSTPVDGDGLVVDDLPTRARLVYTTPSHQFPLGTSMSLARRVGLLAWSERHGAAVVEDDYDSEFRFSARPLEPLHSLDTSGRVLYAGTFSKVLLPALRTGFLIVPATLRAPLRAAKQLSDGHGQVVTQAALAKFMDEGQLARHIRKAAHVYAARRAPLMHALEHELDDLLEMLPSVAGLHVCARLRSGETATVDAVVDAAHEHGIAVERLASYCHDTPARAGFVFGYGAISSDHVPDGIQRFTSLLRQQLARLGGP